PRRASSWSIPRTSPLSKKRKAKLTAGELRFIGAFAGNATEAARRAKYKNPNVLGPRLAARPHVAEAIRQKQNAMVAESGAQLGRGISVTRNDIINRLDKLSQKAESDSAKVSALRELVIIFGLSAKNAKDTDLFAGWTDEELAYYRDTGRLPDRVRSAVGESASDS